MSDMWARFWGADSFQTIIFDIIFVCQHYILYHHKETDGDNSEGERTHLLASDGETLAR